MKNRKTVSFLVILCNALVFLFFSTSCGLYYYDDYSSSSGIYENEGTAYDIAGVTGSGNVFLVDEVVDGDTFLIDSGDTVRLLGINTPEIGRYYYHEAREMLELIIGGRHVTLEKDVSEKDRYGRLLRYVYSDGLFINLEMVKRGYANSYTIPPDIKYTDHFLEAERNAREGGLGLWAISIDHANIRLYLNPDAEGDDRQNLNGEYLVICNDGESDCNIRGWTVKDSGTSIYEFGRFLLKKGKDATLYTGQGKDGEGYFYWESPIPVWNNDHDSVYLRDREGLLIKFFNY